MSGDGRQYISLNEGRFARLEAIDWWDQALLGRARVLVVGVGALGNEVIKNLSLLGVGNMTIVDMDRVEASNLSRSVLFRENDEGKPKAECAARAAVGIYPQTNATASLGTSRRMWVSDIFDGPRWSLEPWITARRGYLLTAPARK
jgi:molybdopterin/thiamine biosynthesis adenylyltransferase